MNFPIFGKYAARAVVLTGALNLNRAHALIEEEFTFVNEGEVTKQFASFSDKIKPYIVKPDSNKLLNRCYNNRNDNQIQIYYPATYDGKFYQDSAYPYARVAVTTVNASITQISELWFQSQPEKRNQWSKHCLQYDNVFLGNKYDHEEVIAKQVKDLPDKKKKPLIAPPKPKVVSTVAPSNSMLSNVHFDFAWINCANSLPPREFYMWNYKCPGATVGLFDNFNTVCVLQLDACRYPSLFKSDKHMSQVVPDAAHHLNKNAIRGHANSCIVLEYVSPERTRVIYLTEMDPNIHWLYASSRSSGWWQWALDTVNYMLFTSSTDSVYMLDTLKALKKQVESASMEELNLSVEEAAKVRFKKQLSAAEQQRLSSSLNMDSTSAEDPVSDEAIQDQEALVSLLEKKLKQIDADYRQNSKTAELPADFYQNLIERISADQKKAVEKLANLKELQLEQRTSNSNAK